MTQTFDGNYDYTKPWRAPVQPDQVAKRWQYNGPWASNMERLTSQALMIMNIPGAEIQGPWFAHLFHGFVYSQIALVTETAANQESKT
jgi:hypothetical protein